MTSRDLNLVFSATFTAEPVRRSLVFWLEKLGIKAAIQYENQVFKQLLDPYSAMRQNNGINVILIRFDDWFRVEDGLETELRKDALLQSKVDRNIVDLLNAVKTSVETTSAIHIVCICPPSPLMEWSTETACDYKEIENRLYQGLQGLNGIVPVASSDILDLYPVADYYDFHSDKMGHIPYKQIFFDALGTVIARKIYSATSLPYKVIVLDCDQTLWKGICGEDGVDGIEVDPYRKQLQAFMLEQQRLGMLLCLCSKNNESDIMAALNRSDMLIKPEHIAASRINWDRKSDNLDGLAKELNLGLDSFIFIDDNPVECMEVKTRYPQVLTLCLPENDEDIPLYLSNIWAFDRINTTAADESRTELVKQNTERNKFQQEMLSYEAFISGLELNVSISPLGDAELARAAQLTQRVNQFNFTTIRHSEAELKRLGSEENVSCFTVAASDRFGDYGIVGLVVCREQGSKLIVDSFLLSCRALGKGIEYTMLARIGELATAKGLDQVDVVFVPTAKNQPAAQFLDLIGAQNAAASAENNVYAFTAAFARTIDFRAYLEQAGHIREEVHAAAQQAASGADPVNLDVLDDIGRHLNTPRSIHAKVEAASQGKTGERAEYVAPRNEFEKRILNIWEDVLVIEQIGVMDNLFEVGGESIKAIQILSRIREEFEVDLPMTVLFEGSLTIAGLAEAVETSLLSSFDEDSIAEQLAALENLTEEEIEQLLREESE
ncbi:HAD-IIIC family phosphatase [Paenibacillus algorifonticola]|uniref:HAD-IIIC family phosphatase n=1 Tax=Paenibacillus algorifonticola TaxID=684063 RepID=UPI003D28E3D1